MLAYSEVLKEADKDKDPHDIANKDLGIKLKNLKKFMTCVLKLALCSGTEIMLDYPIEKLASATAEKCFENQGVPKDGAVNLD